MNRNINDFYEKGPEIGRQGIFFSKFLISFFFKKSGTYATVFKAINKETKEIVAIKEIRKKNMAKFLEREISIMQKVKNFFGFFFSQLLF